MIVCLNISALQCFDYVVLALVTITGNTKRSPGTHNRHSVTFFLDYTNHR